MRRSPSAFSGNESDSGSDLENLLDSQLELEARAKLLVVSELLEFYQNRLLRMSLADLREELAQERRRRDRLPLVPIQR